MRNRILANLILGATLLFGAASAARAQGTHLGVPAKNMTVIVGTNITEDGITFTPVWSEERFTSNLAIHGDTYIFSSKDKALVITDVEYTVQCVTASTTTPFISTILNDDTGTGYLYLDRFRPTLLVQGREQVKTSFTSGVALPHSYQIPFPTSPSVNYRVMRIALYGYYAD